MTDPLRIPRRFATVVVLGKSFQAALIVAYTLLNWHPRRNRKARHGI